MLPGGCSGYYGIELSPRDSHALDPERVVLERFVEPFIIEVCADGDVTRVCLEMQIRIRYPLVVIKNTNPIPRRKERQPPFDVFQSCCMKADSVMKMWHTLGVIYKATYESAARLHYSGNKT